MSDQRYLEENDRLLSELDRTGQRKHLPSRGDLSLSSNDYLALTRHPRLIAAAKNELDRSGTGSGGSRLLAGNHPLNRDLETAISAFKRGPSALVFSTGYQANLSTLSALGGLIDLFYSDELNHASLIDGLRLSKKETVVFPHNNTQWIREDLARRDRNGEHLPRFMIVTESLFSMEGDQAPLSDLIELAEERNGLLLIDEAHATGTLGPTGRGALEAQGIEWDPDRVILTGTFSKALGGLGGFAVCHPDYRELLISKGRGFIYSTSLPPSVLASNLEAIRLLDEDSKTVSLLQQRVRSIGSAIGLPSGDSPILPIQAPIDHLLRFQEHLLESGLWAPIIHPPTVPEGSERIRMSITLGWEETWIQRVIKVFGQNIHMEAH
ncbi:MAG: aminotransferase class I/II-fold pyridoxal phosphate-dependent enzyme [Leptospirales bacterium]